MRRSGGAWTSRAGVTLTELMVAVALLSVAIVAFFGAFQYVSKSLHLSRAQTLATNLAQEQIEILKNLGYYDLLVSTATAGVPGFSAYLYDTSNYPPQTISISGIAFTRYTYVTLAAVDSDVISAVAYTYPDTGLKQISVYVTWTDAGTQKIWTLNNLLENPDVNTLNSGFSGRVSKADGSDLAGAVVKIEQEPDRFATSDSGGNYSLAVASGSYSVRASSAGYYDSVSAMESAASGAYTTVDLSLSPIASGTVAGNAWFNPGLVISQVVGTTNTATACCGAKDVEYVELFNPTTAQISLAQNTGSGNHSGENFFLNTQIGSSNHDDIMSCGGTQCVFVSSYVKAGGYFLIASFPTFMINGQWVTADAYYNATSSPPNDIANYSCGSVQLTDGAGDVVDQVCWDGGSCSGVSLRCNGTRIPTDPDCGFNTGLASPGCQGSPWEGNQFVRFSSPAVLGRGSYGSAYNAQNNATDFQYPVSGSMSTLGINDSPFVSTSAALPVIAGVPAVGAEVAATDAYSGSTTTSAAYASSSVGSQLYAPFTLTGVTTGTWSVDVASVAAGGAAYFTEISAVTATQGAVTPVPNAATSPAWAAGGVYSVLLSSNGSAGFLKGTVADVDGTPLSGIQVLAGGAAKTTGANGTYFAVVSTGVVSDIANPANANPAYIQQIAAPTVTAGQIATQDFVLSQGGSVTGYLTTGTTPLSSFIVAALSGGSQAGAASSDSSGHFTIRDLSTGTYTIEPVTGSGQASSPSSVSATLSSGGDSVSVGTFTITGAFGSIAGSVLYDGAPVTSGAMIIASTGTLTVPPAAIYGSSCTALTPVYAVSSSADGSYSLPVRAADGYHLLVAMPTVGPDGSVTVLSKTYSGISVSASAATPQDVSLP